MSPEIYIDGKLVADVPDETGMHQTLNGAPLYVNIDNINADAKRQRIILEAEDIGGKRELGLTLEGLGNSNDRRRGDKKSPEISVRLLCRPIRVTYSKLYSNQYGGLWRGIRETHKNPRWVKGHGQR